MPLDKQLIPLSLGIGIDTKTDPKQVVPTKLLSLHNAIFGEGGAINKRNGYNSLNSISAGNAIASFQDQLVALDGFNLSSYSANQDQFNNVGKKTSIDISKKNIARRSGNYQFSNIAYHNGLYALIHTNNIISIIDSVTGQYLIKDQTVAGGTQFQSFVHVLGTKFIFVMTTVSEIKYFYVDTVAPTVISPVVTLQTDYAPVAMDCIVAGTNLVFSYTDNTTQISNFYLSSTLVKSATFKVNFNPICLGIFADALNNIWVGNIIDNTTDRTINYFILNPTITALVLPQTLIETTGGGITGISINGIYNGTNGEFYYTLQLTTAPISGLDAYIQSATVNVLGAIVVPFHTIVRSVSQTSKPFIYNGTTYMTTAFLSPGNLQSTYFLIDESGFISAKMAPGGAGDIGTAIQLRQVIQLSPTQFTFSYTEADGETAQLGFVYFQYGISQMFLDFNAPTVSDKLGENLQLSGGLLSMFDGANIVEHGYNVFPESYTNPVVHATGGAILAGTYQYKYTYEWTDSQGQVHRSAPSPAQTAVTTGSTSSVDVTIPTLRLTDKRDVLLVVYRTLANGTLFYQITSPPIFGTPLTNSKTVNFLTFTDTSPDSVVITHNQLYTNGGELENIEIPSTNIIWTYQNRLLGVYAESPTTIGYSKQVIPGVPVEFTDAFTIIVPEDDAGVTAGIQMDDKCIIFKYNKIYYMVGQGPSANGQNNDFTTPIVISTDCGCIDKKSVVLMPMGVMFKSTKGIYLLERSLNVKYIGDDVEAYNSNVITASEMLESVNQIRFTLDSEVCLTYDYYYDQWSVFTNVDAIDSCIFQNVYTYITSDGDIFQETPGVYTDDGAFIPISFTTAWFSFAKIQGFQRAYKLLILGQYYSPHTLQVQFSVNFDSSIVQTVSVPVLSSLVPYQNRVFITQQKCESYQLTITEQQDAPFGRGLSLSALTFEVGGKKGLYKMPSANSYG